MTVKELIEELKKYPENMRIVVADSVWGTEEIRNILVRKNFKIWEGLESHKEDVLKIQ